MKALKRLWFVWHSWVGLTAGLMLFVVCWSGTFAVLADEVDLLVNPSLQAAHSDTLAWDAAYDAAIVAQPDIADIALQAPSGPGQAISIVGTDEEGDLRHLYADPATGRIIAHTTFFNVQRFFRSFHRNLFLVGLYEFGGAGTGDLIVTSMAIILLLQLITSLVFYKRWWRGFWALDWRRGPKIFWSSVHKAGGVWSLWFVALMAATGIWYLVEFYLPPTFDEGKLPVVAADADRRLNLAAAIAAAERAYPGFSARSVTIGPVAVEVNGQDGSLFTRDRGARVLTTFDGARVLQVQQVADLSALDRWTEMADPLHFGDFGGLWSQIPWFLFGIILSGLSLTGAYLHVKRQRRRGETQLRTPIFLSYAATLAILIVSARYGWLEIMDYGPEGRWPVVPTAAIVFIGAWIVSAIVALTLWMKAVR
ncbi:PepSY-associated TM helix domain-containing protein [Sphingosinicella sp.]|uniref:PepSY-associated TM helix domain-containing protein n=1 Tax=Sphingosinicella sp. TaxID=1917971 RepID=UPI0040383FEA